MKKAKMIMQRVKIKNSKVMRNIIIGICLAFLLASCQKEEQLDATFTMEVKGFVEEECYTFASGCLCF